MVSPDTPKLFTPFKLGGSKSPVELNRRVVMAPLTRLRTGESGVPTVLMAEYYAQRATDGGLLIAEAANISPTARGYFGAPGLFNQAQIDGWKLLTKALWHTGRVGHPLNQPDGQLPVSSSATRSEDITTHAVKREDRKDYVTPRALEIEEIPGFDGVEIHAANGYLLEEFLCDSVNQCTDRYGGSIENRARLTLEVVEAILSSLPSSQVAIRLSPFGDTFGCKDSKPREMYGYVVNKLNDYDLAYLHVIKRRGMHAPNVQVPEVGVARNFRFLYKGVLVTAAGFDQGNAVQTVEEGVADFVAFGRDFIANPDLVERLRSGAELNTQNRNLFYPQPGDPLETGYTGYPFLIQN
ncbi:hypothetical protein PHYSODRAFT_249510 [Phytophthora sojae]|uniref:NADH:flavin oxidoreductase/NADH oxidase N-terminal domain-containing protein n=1 Tax=Phytophthora sojae (strain P6497) TaxID=1094619 RepID=G4Z7Y0_PHYSP|nr:hypothetical protein PHYSODRAFT_249510 [Phytophthora sojae]EGZ22515.1 hypothetical protein PHYSODRAFT_249510 [Phytophthora sojae]|eukprot:XP_009525232.1 hypothetical protein PHYSODRAFT_249510 [Phytophthora sojae]